MNLSDMGRHRSETNRGATTFVTIALMIGSQQKITKQNSSQLALLGGHPTVTNPRDDLFQWPLIGAEEEKAVLEQLRKPNYSDNEIVPAFEHEFAERLGTDYAIAESSGTNAILAALFGCGVGRGAGHCSDLYVLGILPSSDLS